MSMQTQCVAPPHLQGDPYLSTVTGSKASAVQLRFGSLLADAAPQLQAQLCTLLDALSDGTPSGWVRAVVAKLAVAGALGDAEGGLARQSMAVAEQQQHSAFSVNMPSAGGCGAGDVGGRGAALHGCGRMCVDGWGWSRMEASKGASTDVQWEARCAHLQNSALPQHLVPFSTATAPGWCALLKQHI